MDGTFSVTKALNNNVVICEASSGSEAIFIGKGIGFGKKRGDTFDETTYDKVYSLVSEQEREQYSKLVTRETEETMLLIHEAISRIHDAIGRQLNERTLFALTQHIVLALQRTRDQTEIQNPFLIETKWLYHETYGIAEEVVAFIEAETKVKLPEAEIGFITLHIQSAIDPPDRHAPDLITRCIHYAEEKLEKAFIRDSEAFRRLVQHLRQSAELPLTSPETNIDHQIYLLLKKEHPLCYNISRNVIRMIEKSTGVPAAERDIVQTMFYLLTAASYSYENA
ncbi:PRD domain-containing protein [Alkalicoccus daliensis]|uniref:Transcriptional antiterminator, BglG family n=1 Tax=Alkalicoccus daliensis TaxID=745820 RepID=A0A1H0CHS3_9BACI|nr:PRD domain-containing protein [Alkalicoccus daliensis]SDN57458.1 transcriptional antiterminator, BglG family [Alkalicoccus daliensis]